MLNVEIDTVENLIDNKAIKDEKVKKAKATKKQLMSMDEAWERIKSMNNSAADIRKLSAVHAAMANNSLGREQGSENKNFTKAEALRLYAVLEESLRGERLDKLVTDTPDNYILVDHVNCAEEMVSVLAKEPIIAVDTETTGLNVYEETIVGVSFTAPIADKHYYIPLAHDEMPYFDKRIMVRIIECMKMVLSLDNEKVFHNAIFDLHMFYNNSYTVNGKVHDTMVMMHILNENEPSFRLKDLAPKYLKIESDTFDALFGKNCKFNTVALKYARYYACKDTHITWLLYDFCKRNLEATDLWDYYTKVEQPLIRAVHSMEAEGFVIDINEASDVANRMRKEVEELQEKLIGSFGDINFNSPVQLLPAINEVLTSKGEKPIDSTAKASLKPLKHVPEIALLLEYRQVNKLLNDFIEKIPQMIQKDGKLHGSFNQAGTVTGRFSARNPNLQQLPKSARGIFKTDENSLILGLDFKAQEPRMLAHYSQEPKLLDCYNNNRDMYAVMASDFYKKPYEECFKNPDGSDTKERVVFKVVFLAVTYGMGAGALADSLGITKKKAQELIDGLFENYPNVAQFVAENTEEACRDGFVKLELGNVFRKRRLPWMKGQNAKNTYDTYTTNAKMQGTSAIQTKLCMIAGYDLCRKLSTGIRQFNLLASVHDEILFKVPKDVTREEIALFEAVMTDTVTLNNVPSGTDGELGVSWGNTIPVDLYFKNK